MRVLKIFIVFVLLMSSVAVTFAEEVQDIKLRIEGELVEFDVPPVIVNGRTLVPVRAIAEASGAEVGWDEASRVVTITTVSAEIKLTIDKTTALVDSKQTTLDTPAQIISDRTFVPVRFVGESFGYNVRWNDKYRTVYLTIPEDAEIQRPQAPEEEDKEDNGAKRVRLSTIGSANTEKGYRITIKFSSALKGDYNMFELEDPQRLIIDFEDAEIDYSRQFDFSNKTVKSARVGNHDNFMRVVIDLAEPADYEEYMSTNEDALILFFDVESDEDEEDETDTQPDKEDEGITDDETVEGNITIVIDPGHGGSDPGALGKENGVTVAYEDEVNLAVSLILRDILEEAGVNVIMTREKSERISLGDRCTISNNANADLFVSVHSNAMDEGKEHINGTMVFFGQSKDAAKPWLASKKLASNILTSLCDSIDTTNLGVQNGDQLAVIRGTLAPAVLVELAFITNEEDRAKLVDPEYQEKAAQGIALGILESLK